MLQKVLTSDMKTNALAQLLGLKNNEDKRLSD